MSKNNKAEEEKLGKQLYAIKGALKRALEAKEKINSFKFQVSGEDRVVSIRNIYNLEKAVNTISNWVNRSFAFYHRARFQKYSEYVPNMKNFLYELITEKLPELDKAKTPGFKDLLDYQLLVFSGLNIRLDLVAHLKNVRVKQDLEFLAGFDNVLRENIDFLNTGIRNIQTKIEEGFNLLAEYFAEPIRKIESKQRPFENFVKEVREFFRNCRYDVYIENENGENLLIQIEDFSKISKQEEELKEFFRKYKKAVENIVDFKLEDIDYKRKRGRVGDAHFKLYKQFVKIIEFQRDFSLGVHETRINYLKRIYPHIKELKEKVLASLLEE